jgi:hydroxyacylglutathione hydrolase
MMVERFEVPGLAQYSYVVSDGGRAAVIDPIRDFGRYVAYAKAQGLQIIAVLETHLHADFAAGSVGLVEATGAEFCVSAYDVGEQYVYERPHRALADGDSVVVGGVRLQAMHTPGHTPEHLSFLLFDGSGPVALFSGDFLFAGSLGRPDLLGDAAKVDLAHALYRSLHGLVGLQDELTVYPGHGAGSLCGSGMSGHAETTLGYERTTNAFFRYGEEEFVAKILGGVPPLPDYYPRMKELNAAGAAALVSLPGGRGLLVAKVAAFAQDEEFALVDLRTPKEFGAGHVAGALNLGVGGNLSLWAGWMLDAEKTIVLIGDGDEEARLSLVRVGLDRIAGHLDGGMAAWIAEGMPVVRTAQVTPDGVASEAVMLDVRNDAELVEGMILGARHAMLGTLPGAVEDLPRDTPLVTVCAGGYRSSLAASVLERAGFTDVGSLAGGMGAWVQAGMRLVR